MVGFGFEFAIGFGLDLDQVLGLVLGLVWICFGSVFGFGFRF